MTTLKCVTVKQCQPSCLPSHHWQLKKIPLASGMTYTTAFLSFFLKWHPNRKLGVTSDLGEVWGLSVEARPVEAGTPRSDRHFQKGSGFSGHCWVHIMLRPPPLKIPLNPPASLTVQRRGSFLSAGGASPITYWSLSMIHLSVHKLHGLIHLVS